MVNPEIILNNLIKDIFNNEFSEDDEINVNEICTGGANYSSKVYKVNIKKKKETLKLFAKVAMWPETVRNQLNFGPAFENERIFYTDILPAYEMLQTKHKIKDEDRFIAPKYFGSNANYMEETIVLEDLIEEGYNLYDRFAPMDWAYASKTVEELAKLHALSFAYKRYFSESYAKTVSLFDFKRSFFINLKEPYYETAKNVSQIVPEHLRAKFLSFIEHQLSDELFEKYYGSGKWGVLLHGDFRSSNIMYRASNDSKAASIVPVDYQNVHYGSPSTDLYYLIYTGTDANFRKLHLKNLLNHYYETLTKWLIQMNLKPDEIFSKKDFEEDYKEMSDYGLCVATFLLPIVLVKANEAPSFSDEPELTDFTLKLSEAFKDRFLTILDEYVQIGIFNNNDIN